MRLPKPGPREGAENSFALSLVMIRKERALLPHCSFQGTFFSKTAGSNTAWFAHSGAEMQEKKTHVHIQSCRLCCIFPTLRHLLQV